MAGSSPASSTDGAPNALATAGGCPPGGAATRDSRWVVFDALAPHLGEDRVASTIGDLRERRAEAKKHTAAISKQIRNEGKKRTRMVRKAARISNMELVDVMMHRARQRQLAAVRAAEAEAQAAIAQAALPNAPVSSDGDPPANSVDA